MLVNEIDFLIVFYDPVGGEDLPDEMKIGLLLFGKEG